MVIILKKTVFQTRQKSQAAAVLDFKLLIPGIFLNTFPALILALMVPDACGNPGRHLGCRNLYDAVTEMFLLTGRNGDTDIRQENTVRTKHLTELPLMDIQWIDLVVIDDRTQSWTGKGKLSLWIFAL